VAEKDYNSEGESDKETDENHSVPLHQFNAEEESDNEAISDTMFGENDDEQGNVDDSVLKETSYGPFKIYDLLHKNDKVADVDGTNSSIPFPSGFTPEKVTPIQEAQNLQEDHDISIDKSVGCSSCIVESTQKVDEQLSPRSHSNGHKIKKGGSILGILEEMIKVGQTMGFNMEGCTNDMEKIIGSQGVDNETKSDNISDMVVKNIWGNSIFEASVSESIGLVEIQLEGYNYTWAHPSASKMSKLDRFLVSDGLLSVFPYISAVCLDRHLSDHRPILLREVIIDYGAIPFRFFHSWFDFQGFDIMATQTWNSIMLTDNNGMIQFKKKLQILKKEIRKWIADRKKIQMGNVQNIRSKLRDIDISLDQGEANDDLLVSRTELMNQLHDFKTTESREYIQKAKIKWAVEGDENSKFFYGIVNRKRANLAVKGVMIDGEWVDEPNRVKDEFRNHFAARFNEPGPCHGYINHSFPNRLNDDQAAKLEIPITRDEIRLVVWG
ncbi:RNA-directed DNA polymerase, eukaryota, partial [Tanacetum coccineum]